MSAANNSGEDAPAAATFRPRSPVSMLIQPLFVDVVALSSWCVSMTYTFLGNFIGHGRCWIKVSFA
jgi:hypothetical protein